MSSNNQNHELKSEGLEFWGNKRCAHENYDFVTFVLSIHEIDKYCRRKLFSFEKAKVPYLLNEHFLGQHVSKT